MLSKVFNCLRRHNFIEIIYAVIGRLKLAVKLLELRIESCFLFCRLGQEEKESFRKLNKRLSQISLIENDAAGEQALRETYTTLSQLGPAISSRFAPVLLWKEADKVRKANVPENWSQRDNYFSNFRVNSLSGFIATGPRLEQVQAPDFPRARYCLDLIRKFKRVESGLAKKKLMDLCHDSLVGNPVFIEYRGKRINHQILRRFFNFSRVEQYCEISQRPVMLEIGAGFGDLGRLFKLWNPHCTYVIVDLPETLILSYYYLRRCFPNAKMLVAKSGIVDWEKNDCGFIFLPHWAVEAIPADRINIIINTASFGEMELEVSRSYIEEILRMNSRYFYSVNHKVTIQKSLGTAYGCDEYLGPLHAAGWNLLINEYAWIEDVFWAFGASQGITRYWETLFENPNYRKTTAL